MIPAFRHQAPGAAPQPQPRSRWLLLLGITAAGGLITAIALAAILNKPSRNTRLVVTGENKERLKTTLIDWAEKGSQMDGCGGFRDPEESSEPLRGQHLSCISVPDPRRRFMQRLEAALIPPKTLASSTASLTDILRTFKREELVTRVESIYQAATANTSCILSKGLRQRGPYTTSYIALSCTL